MPRRAETTLDFGGALVARVITRRGPVVVAGFEVVEAGLVIWGLRFVAVFDGRRGRCETALDSWIAGSFLGRSSSSSPELVAFRFKLAIVGKDEEEEEAKAAKEITDDPKFRFSWSVCSLGKRDIWTFACWIRRTRSSVESEPRSHHCHVTLVVFSRASIRCHGRDHRTGAVPGEVQGELRSDRLGLELNSFLQAREVYTKVAE